MIMTTEEAGSPNLIPENQEAVIEIFQFVHKCEQMEKPLTIKKIQFEIRPFNDIHDCN